MCTTHVHLNTYAWGKKLRWFLLVLPLQVKLLHLIVNRPLLSKCSQGKRTLHWSFLWGETSFSVWWTTWLHAHSHRPPTSLRYNAFSNFFSPSLSYCHISPVYPDVEHNYRCFIWLNGIVGHFGKSAPSLSCRELDEKIDTTLISHMKLQPEDS